MRIFDKRSTPVDKVLSRIDDSLNLLQKAKWVKVEDIETELIEDLILVRVARKGDTTTRAHEIENIRVVCDEIIEMLVAKNRAYGDSALNPVRIFSKATPVEQILVRLDDKLSRLARGSAAGEDVELDLIGYLVLLQIARKRGLA